MDDRDAPQRSTVPDEVLFGCTAVPVVVVCAWLGMQSQLPFRIWGSLCLGLGVATVLLVYAVTELVYRNSVLEWQSQQRLLASRGGGNPQLAVLIEQCDQRIQAISRDTDDLKARLRILGSARSKLQASSFREQAAPYVRAEKHIQEQLRLRLDLVAQWRVYLRDLEALAAAGEAESALDGLPGQLELAESVSAERERLERLTGEVSAVAEVEQLPRE